MSTRNIFSYALLLCLFATCTNKEPRDRLRVDVIQDKQVKQIPKAVKGILDLRDWDLTKNGEIKLNGEWEFYWGELLEPPIDNPKSLIQNLQFISVPSSWNNYQLNGQAIGKAGFATYRLKISLDKPLQGLTLKTDHIGTAFKLWVNGTLLKEVGKVSKERKNAKPGYLVKSFLLSESFQELDIVLQVSNYHDRNGGFWRSFILGTNEDIWNQTLANHFLSFFLFGCLILMGIYHLGLYRLRKKDSSPFWFGLFSILLSFRSLLVGESILYELFPESWVFLHKIEYLTVYGTLPLFVNFVHSIFPIEFNLQIKKWINAMGTSSSLFVIFFPSYYYTETLLVYQIFLILACFHFTFVLIKAARKERMGAKIFLTGWSFSFATILNDVLHHQLIIYTFTLFPLGFFVFIISQAIVLSMRFSQAFNKAEELSSDLQLLTHDLEYKIAEGVREQEKYSKCLLELSKSKTIELSDLEMALKEVTETCAKILEIERCSIWVFNGLGNEIKCIDLFQAKESRHSKDIVLKEKDFPTYFAFIKEESGISVPDVYTHPATKEFTEAYSIPSQIYSLLDAPIRSGGRLLGIISCEQVGVQKNWTMEEENFVASTANILASYFETSERKEAFSELRETKQEIEDLNQFTYLINSLSNLDDIFQEVSKYVYGKYRISSTWLFLPDEKKEHLYTHKAYSFIKIPEERYNFLKNKKIPIHEKENALLNITFHRKKPFYSRKITKFNSTIDREFAEALSVKSYLFVPLVRKDTCIGIFGFTNIGEDMILSKTEIRKLSNFCSQIAGTVDSTHLLEQINSSRKEIKKRKEESDALNKLIKSLNDDLNLNHIMQKVLKYVNEKFGIEHFALYNVNLEKNFISLLDISFSEHLKEEDRKKILHFRIPIDNPKGAHAFAIKAKKPFYISKVKKNGGTDEELFVIEKSKIESILLIPLILNNKPIGILDFSNSKKMKLSREDISKLSILGEQLAGIIYGSNLFKELQVAKEQAEIEQSIATIAQNEAEAEREKSENLLLNILPVEVANELKRKGTVEPVYFENATILFTDFIGFTKITEGLAPQMLIKELDEYFSQFDQISERNNLEKLKTIGDSCMCAGGVPKVNSTHAIDSCLAALEIQSFINQTKEQKQILGLSFWELRIGVHSGPLMAGVIGKKKFTYDVWGDTVNTASRMESSGTSGKINISHSTYESVKDLFDCEYRGEVDAKNKGMMKMYYLNRIKKEYSSDEEGMVPNVKFRDAYQGEKA